MRLITSIAEMERERQTWKQAQHTAGLVPTMGYLHAGHLALVERARRENEIVITSIFVNPLQFGPHEDFSRYPRSLERDTALLEQAGVDLVFYPDAAEMYPAGFEAAIEIGGITNGLEGAVRPGHFRGVATVVAKLFNIVGADRAYFGQKDAQQVAVIQKMVRDLNFPLEVIVCPTVREPDGLALSSRNVYLSPAEREAATVLYRALSAAKQLWDNMPPNQRSASQIQQSMAAVVASEALAQPDYISVANALTLVEYDTSELIPLGQKVLLSLAVRFGNTRLIDNFLLL
jgi:pantoate--beta-alanine ligase